MRSQNIAFPSRSSVTTFSALSSSRLPTITDCSFSSAARFRRFAARARRRLRSCGDGLLARRPGRLAGHRQWRLHAACEEQACAARARQVATAWLWQCSFWHQRESRWRKRRFAARSATPIPAPRPARGRRHARGAAHAAASAPPGPPGRAVYSPDAALPRWEPGAASPPVSPARQLRQNVGAHQPDKLHPREAPQQQTQRVDGEAGAQPRLDAVASTRRPSAIRRAPARRCASAAMPALGFSGLPGETSSHT